MPAPIRQSSPAGLAVLLLAAMAALGAAGCSVSQRVTLEPEGSGTAEVRIRLQKVLLDYLLDLSEVSGSKEKGRIFDVEDIRKGFASRQEVTLRRTKAPAPTGWRWIWLFSPSKSCSPRRKSPRPSCP
jgi:hypothetical protein